MTNWDAIPRQTHLVERGQVGDCWRCCIAAVIGSPPESVPHFLDDGEGGLNPHLDADTQSWLNDRGYYMAHVLGRAMYFPRWANRENDCEPPPVISCGPSRRSQGLGEHHSVVTVAGKLVYDPHPSGAGLTAITDEYLVFRFLSNG